MDNDLDLNTSAPLPDATAASQSGGFGYSAADAKRGFMPIDVEQTPRYDADNDGGTTQVGDPLTFNPGFLGRPRGWAR